MIRQVLINELTRDPNYPVIMPVYLPDLDDVCRLAEELHQKGREDHGQYKGWPVVYHPADPEPPAEAWMVKFAASFQLGVWPLWSVYVDWENGSDQPPNIWTWDKNIIKDIYQVNIDDEI